MKTNPQDKMWRTLIRIYSKTGKYVWFIIPGWDTNQIVYCPSVAIPPAIFKGMEKDKRYHVGCNIGAKNQEDLCFDGWESE